MLGVVAQGEVNVVKGQASRGLLPATVAFVVLVLPLVLCLAGNYLHWKRGERVRLVHECHSNIQTVARALEAYAMDHGGRYPSSLNALTGGLGLRSYLNELPTCPAAQRHTFENYKVSGNTVSFGCSFSHQGGFSPEYLTYQSQPR